MAREHLLLVERDAKTRRLLKVSLEQAGYAVETARDGVDAIERLEDATPALMLAATDLPKIDGYALVRQMKENPAWVSIPVIFLVASESIEDKIRGLELGVDEYVSKPIFVKELLSRVQVLLAKRVRQHLSTSVAETRVRGQLEDLPTIDLLESLEGGKQSGIVRIRAGQREGVVFFQDGEIVDARLKRLRGEEVIFRLLSWTQGSYEVELCDVDIDPIVESSTRALIEAGMRHAAEYHRLLEDLPPLSTVLQVNRMALRARMADIPEEINGIIALFDGRRTLLDIIDESPFDDLSTLSTVAKLFEEELLSVVAQGPTALDRAATPLAPEPDYSPGIEEVDDTAVTMRPPSVRADPPVFIDGIGQAAARAVAEPFAVAPLETESLSPVIRTDDTPSSDVAASEAPVEEQAPPTPPRGGEGDRSLRPEVPAYARYDDGDHEDDESLDEHEDDEGFDGDDFYEEGHDEAAGDEPAPPRRIASEPAGPSPVRVPSGVPAALAGSELELPLSDRVTQEVIVEEPGPATPFGHVSRDGRAGSADPSREDARADASEATPGAPYAADEATPGVPFAHAVEPSTGIGSSDVEAGDEADAPDADEEDAAQSDDAIQDEESAPDSQGPPSSRDEESAPSSLSQSGVSAKFFEDDDPHDLHDLHDEVPPSSRDEPVYLTEAQIARKERGRKIVMGVVGALVAVVLFAVIRSNVGGEESTAPATSIASTSPPPAPPSAVGSVAPALAQGAHPSAGGASPNEEGPAEEGPAEEGTTTNEETASEGEDDALSEVEDPLAEALRLLNVGRYKDAIPMAEAAIRKNPEDAEGYFYLATAHESLGNLDGKKKALKACAEKATGGKYRAYCR